MRGRHWRTGLVIVVNVVVMSVCAHRLDAETRGTQTLALSHRTLQLALVIVSSWSWCVLACKVPTRSIMFLGVGASLEQLLVTSDTIWKCAPIHAALKVVGAVLVLALTAIMRKFVERLKNKEGTSQRVTPIQLALCFVYLVSALLTHLVFPNSAALAALELSILFVLCVCMPWMHFFKYRFAAKTAFQDVDMLKNAAATTPTAGTAGNGRLDSILAIKLVRGAKKNLGRHLALCLAFLHLIYWLAILLSPLWSANAISGSCHERVSSETSDLPLVESMRFFTMDVFHIVIIVGIWHAIFIFSARTKRLRREKKAQEIAAAKKEPCSYENKSDSTKGSKGGSNSNSAHSSDCSSDFSNLGGP